jgi:NADPH-dependent 2,4-dienoyl-CoA reductase/sulfur reductase-like enzyme
MSTVAMKFEFGELSKTKKLGHDHSVYCNVNSYFRVVSLCSPIQPLFHVSPRVAIVGAGPAGLTLARNLHLAGILLLSTNSIPLVKQVS